MKAVLAEKRSQTFCFTPIKGKCIHTSHIGTVSVIQVLPRFTGIDLELQLFQLFYTLLPFIDGYLKNAALIRKEMTALGYECVGGDHSPYIWVYGERDSWEFFDQLLNEAGVVCTPGEGFGRCGRGFIRFSAFNSFENVSQAMQNVKQALGN